MKQVIIYTGAYLVVFLLLFFSCKHKTDAGTKESSQGPVVNNSSPTVSKSQSATPWVIDATASKVEFTIKNFGMDVKGSFGGLKGSIFFDNKNLKGSSLEGAVDANTISTGIAKRDEDLKGKKYFDTEKNIQIIFRSDSIIPVGTDYKAVGTLTIKGTSQHRDIPFTFEQNGDKGVFKSQFTVKRHDFDIGGSGPIMGDDANVSLNIVVVKKK